MSKSVSAEDELRDLARLGKRMRQLQRHYFDLRRKKDPDADEVLIASKRAEAEFDKAIVAALEYRTPGLPFDADQAANAGAT